VIDQNLAKITNFCITHGFQYLVHSTVPLTTADPSQSRAGALGSVCQILDPRTGSEKICTFFGQVILSKILEFRGVPYRFGKLKTSFTGLSCLFGTKKGQNWCQKCVQKCTIYLMIWQCCTLITKTFSISKIAKTHLRNHLLVAGTAQWVLVSWRPADILWVAERHLYRPIMANFTWRCSAKAQVRLSCQQWEVMFIAKNQFFISYTKWIGIWNYHQKMARWRHFWCPGLSTEACLLNALGIFRIYMSGAS